MTAGGADDHVAAAGTDAPHARIEERAADAVDDDVDAAVGGHAGERAFQAVRRRVERGGRAVVERGGTLRRARGGGGRRRSRCTRELDRQAADTTGTRNYMGAKDPAIDAMIAELLRARDHESFVSSVRALDRALMSGFYAIPMFNLADQWLARWNRIERPKDTALVGYLPESWWQKPAAQGK